MTASALLWSVLFGSLGSGYCLYGYRQRAPIPALCGLALIALPYIVADTYWLVGLCLLVAAGPFVIRR